MATPTSSATSPSPPMAYLSHTPTPQPPISHQSDTPDAQQRKLAVQKFLQRAEMSQVTRALRARLSYASYKAAHNIPHVALRDLEAQSSQNQAASFSRSIAAKRKASGPPQWYYAPGTPGPSSASPAPAPNRKPASGAMLPPPSLNSPRTHYPSISHPPNSAPHGDFPSTSRHTAPNLYTSILAPPPAKQARTIHNPSDPPVPPPARPTPSPRPRSAHNTPRTDVGRSHVKSRHSDRSSKPTRSPRKQKRASADKGKRKQSTMSVDADGDVDMKAAATLTSLLLHHRPSIATTSSPRSSIDGSETGSAMSYSHFAQSSARMSSSAALAPPSQPPPAPSSVDSLRHNTPPRLVAPVQDQTTPRPPHSEKDSEAADLMLFLATSPSPARPSQDRDRAAYQVLSGDIGRPAGRVLHFQGSASDIIPGESSGGPTSSLARTGEGSFVSSITSIGGELGGGNRTAPSPPLRTLSSSSSQGAPAQLLPPPPLSTPANPGLSKKPAPAVDGSKPSSQAPSIDFNFHDFINASPSPRGAVVPHKPNHSLRVDVGRKLFEEEQIRFAAQSMAGNQGPAPGNLQNVDARGEGQHPPMQQQQSWASGINVAQS